MESRSERIRTSLLAWYDANQRDLPWRRTRDPYHIWVSEIMLQQTRVDAVIPYYERWIATFPDIQTLADADLHDVLKQWEGLGYYSRARNLHGAARLVREKHGGTVPCEPGTLRKLPGVGDYTAGAIASIAYNHRTPAIDGNVRRVVSRLFDVATSTAANTRAYTEPLLDSSRPGDFNQALMDFGATVCTPRAPRCAACSLQQLCYAYARGTIPERPARRHKKAIPHQRVATLVYRDSDRVVLEQRASNGLLAGLWQFPEASDPPPGSRILGEVTHTFSHKRITYVVCAVAGCPDLGQNQRWVVLHQARAYPMSAAQRKIEKLVEVDLQTPGD